MAGDMTVHTRQHRYEPSAVMCGGLLGCGFLLHTKTAKKDECRFALNRSRTGTGSKLKKPEWRKLMVSPYPERFCWL